MSSSRGNLETRYPHVWLTFVYSSRCLDPKSLEIRIALHEEGGGVKRYTRIIKEEEYERIVREAHVKGCQMTFWIQGAVEYLSEHEGREELKEPLSYLLKKVENNTYSYRIPGGPKPDVVIW
jgi:hypothetical protein